MEMINKAVEFVQKPEVIAVLVFVIEMLMRVIKTQKPWSIMHAAKRIMRMIANVLGAMADVLDKILPQNIAELVIEEQKL